MAKSYLHDEERLARLAKAMGHPARIAILNFFASHPSCLFSDISDILPISKATVSQHLSELKDVGLIRCEVVQPKGRYCMDPDSWAEAKLLLDQLLTFPKQEE